MTTESAIKPNIEVYKATLQHGHLLCCGIFPFSSKFGASMMLIFGQPETRMQTAPRSEKALTEFLISLPGRSMETVLCWRFPHANKAERRSHGVFHH